MSRKRRNHSPEFKAKIALDAIKGGETLSQLSERHAIDANLIVEETIIRNLRRSFLFWERLSTGS
jgi:hypothetical protein